MLRLFVWCWVRAKMLEKKINLKQKKKKRECVNWLRIDFVTTAEFPNMNLICKI